MCHTNPAQMYATRGKFPTYKITNTCLIEFIETYHKSNNSNTPISSDTLQPYKILQLQIKKKPTFQSPIFVNYPYKKFKTYPTFQDQSLPSPLGVFIVCEQVNWLKYEPVRFGALGVWTKPDQVSDWSPSASSRI